MGRRETREQAMKMLYQVNIQRDDIAEQIARFADEHTWSDAEEKDYFMTAVQGVIDLSAELDKRINDHSRGWTVERMPKVDLAIMRLAIYELLYMSDIPPSVSINEAVELTKKYGTDQSKSYVNGVLANIYTEIQAGSAE